MNWISAAEGFEWVDWQDADSSVLCWIRRGADGSFVICISNFTPLVRSGYRVGVPQAGCYTELLNTDSEKYGGSGVGIFARDSYAGCRGSRTAAIIANGPTAAGNRDVANQTGR